MAFKMTREQVEAHQKKHGFPPPFQTLMEFAERGKKAQAAVDKILRGKQPNQTEAEFGRILEAQKTRGEIQHYEFEGIRLKWGVDPKTGEAMYYKPDWFVVVAFSSQMDGIVLDWKEFVKLRCVEVKGAKIWDRDLVRFKGARAAWPFFEFEMWQKAKGIWKQLH